MKSWYTSQTILGLIATALATAVQASGRTWAPEDYQEIVNALALVGQGGGLLWAVWGRWRATGPLTVGKGTGAGAVASGLVLMLVLGGCGGRLPGAGADNKITTTTTQTDGSVVTKVEEISDATTYINGQVRAKEVQKPLWEMEAQDGQKISLDGVKAIRVYANTGTDIKAYVSAFERIVINGMPLLAMVAQNYISADMAVKIANAVGATAANAGDKTYNITTQDGGPVLITQSGNIGNATVTVSKPTTTTTTSDDHSGGVQ